MWGATIDEEMDATCADDVGGAPAPSVVEERDEGAASDQGGVVREVTNW